MKDSDGDGLPDYWEQDHSEFDFDNEQTIVEDFKLWGDTEKKYSQERAHNAQMAYLTAEANINLNQLDWSNKGPHFINRGESK